MLPLKGTRKGFHKGTPDESVLFDNFNFSVEEGEFVSIVGSNGSGKTTLLNLIAGSMQPEAGHILLRGEDITAQKEFVRARRIGRVFQDPALGAAGPLTIAENMAIPQNQGKPYRPPAALCQKTNAPHPPLPPPSSCPPAPPPPQIRISACNPPKTPASAPCPWPLVLTTSERRTFPSSTSYTLKYSVWPKCWNTWPFS